MTFKPLSQGLVAAGFSANARPTAVARLTGDELTFDFEGKVNLTAKGKRRRKRAGLSIAKAAAPIVKPAAPEDVTADFSDLAPEDRVYRCPSSGYLVKVKVVVPEPVKIDSAAAPTSLGHELFELSGSIVGQDGKCLRRNDGSLAVHKLKQTHHLMSDAAADPVVGVERARIACVVLTVRAERHHQLKQAAIDDPGTGLVTATMQAARKAAEALDAFRTAPGLAAKIQRGADGDFTTSAKED